MKKNEKSVVEGIYRNKKISDFTQINLLGLITVIISLVSLLIAHQSVKVSQLAIKQSSAETEPLISFDINYYDNTFTATNKTSDIFKIYHVNYGTVRNISINDSSSLGINSIEIVDKLSAMNLEHGHTTGTDTSDKDAEKYNKSFYMSLMEDDPDRKWIIRTNNTSFINNLEDAVIERCESDNNYEHVFLSTYYNFGFIEIFYLDSYGNRSIQYYIYKYEYQATWRFYKLDEIEYLEYVKNVFNVDLSNENEKDRLLQVVFDQNNFIDVRTTKFMYDDFNAPSYEIINNLNN